MKLRKVKVGDFLIRVKDLIPIEKDKEYRLVTIKLYHKGVHLRKKEIGSQIQANKMSKVRAGQFILSGIDARNGAFGIIPEELDGAVVTNDFWHFNIDESIITSEYFLWLTCTSFFDDICKKASDGTTNRIRLQADRFFSQELSIPEIENQHSVVAELKQQSDKIEFLQKEYQFQLTQIENLNQAILQEAVQGKLVSQDPNDEPASELLKRIKTQKRELGKKGKTLPLIKPEEIPFEIPESWAWCRLGELIQYTDNLDIQKHLLPDTIINYVDIDAIDNQNQVITEPKIKTVRELSTRARRVLKKDYIAYSTVRPYLKNIAIIEDELENYIGSTGFNVFKAVGSELKYAFYYLLTPYINNSFKEKMVGFNSPSITNIQFENSLFPLPPLSEQKRIVAEVEKQLAKTKQLKEHTIANQQATDQLLKALLHEAFVDSEAKEVKTEEKEAKVLVFKPTNVDYYKRTVLAAEIVWQLHKEPTLGHLKLQKLIYLCQKSAQMQLPTNFLRQAMGPYDPQMMRSIDKQLKEKKWFDFQIKEMLKYKPLEKAGQHHTDFEKYFSEEQASIQFIIDTFKIVKSDYVEIVGTLYACLEKMNNEKVFTTENLLLQRFYEWSDEKLKFEESKVRKVYNRMLELGIVPQ